MGTDHGGTTSGVEGNGRAGHTEPHAGGGSGRLGGLRAGVLGANDGIVSVASIVAGVAGATAATSAILTAGIAGLFAGALSMASGEYVSVASQRDAEHALLATERDELATDPEAELVELTEIYQAKGLSPDLARQVAEQLTAHDALGAHAEAELGVDPAALTNPWQAVAASFAAFTLGAVFPLLAAVLTSAGLRLPITLSVVTVTLILTGAVSARLGGAPRTRAIVRNVLGGLAAMAITYGIGILAGHTFT